MLYIFYHESSPYNKYSNEGDLGYLVYYNGPTILVIRVFIIDRKWIPTHLNPRIFYLT